MNSSTRASQGDLQPDRVSLRSSNLMTSRPKYLLDGHTTGRLSFRKIEVTDFDACRPFFLNPQSNRYWKSAITDPNELAREWFNKQLWRYEHHRGGMNLLVHRESKQVAGWCGLLLQEVDAQEELEVAYSIMPEYWRQGFATEAARACIDYAFTHRLRDSLISIIHVENVESTRVAIKNGLTLSRTTTYRDNPVNFFRISSTAIMPKSES